MLLADVASQQLPDPEVIRTIIPGITEGGAIILGVLAVLILTLFYFGRFFAKKLEATLSELRSTKAEVTATKKVAAAGTYQVQNNHDSNLRDDLDQKHTDHGEKLDKILEMVGSRFDRMNDRISGLDDRVTGIDKRLNGRRPFVDSGDRQDENREG